MDRHRGRLQRDSTKKETEEVDEVSLQPAYLCVCVNNWALKMSQKLLHMYQKSGIQMFTCFAFSSPACMRLTVFYR